MNSAIEIHGEGKDGCEQRSTKVAENELLYLVLKYFQSLNGFEEISNLLESQLIQTGKFGKAIDWDGSNRTLTLQDFQRKFPFIGSNHLLSLLASAVTSKQSTATALNQSCSLLHSINGSYHPNDSKLFALFRTRSSDFSLLCGRLRENQRKLEFLKAKQNLLTSPQMQQSIQPAQFQQILFSDGEIDLTGVTEYEEANPNWKSNHVLLYEADVSRQIQKLSTDIPGLEISIQSDKEDQSRLKDELREMGCLVNGKYRGNLDCGIDFLTQRMLTITKWNSNSFRPFAPSAGRIQRRFFTHFQRLCTVSGHSYNPVYCSVFDMTGNFLITGADDYLVKIWDVNKGQLIRTCRGHKNYISLIAVCPDNSMFASACTGGTIRVWRLHDGLCLLVMHHHAPVNWLKFDLMTGCLASAGDDGFTMVWDLVKLIDTEKSDSPLLQRLRRQQQSSEMNVIPSQESSSYDNSLHVIPASSEATSSSFPEFPAPPLPPSTSSAVTAAAVEIRDDSIIGLPHLQDLSISSMHGDPKKVLSIDISPLGNIIITGCDDGVVRVWRYGSSTAHYPSRAVTRDMKADLARMKNQLSSQDYVKYERIVNHLLLRLEGHVSPVTDVQINSLGDRLLSASTQDGSVRIWSLNSDYSDSVHIILDLADEYDEVGDSLTRTTTSIRNRARGMNARRNRSQIHVFNVCWTCDDQRVITLQSVPNQAGVTSAGGIAGGAAAGGGSDTDPTRLKVWNSITGELLRIIKNVSDTAARCIARHPRDPQIAVTAGEDGVVNFWNIEEEENIANFKLSIESIETPGSFMAANVVDLSFTPDGSRLVATDYFGRWTMFGLDDPKVFEKVIAEQYFSSDYSEILHDEDGNALDVGTQLPVHLSPVGFLCDIHGAAYGFNPVIRAYPRPLPRGEIEEKLKAIQQDNRIAGRERERMFRYFQRCKETGRGNAFLHRRRLRESPNTAAVNTTAKSALNPIRPFQPLRTRHINYIEFDVNQYQPSSEEETFDSDWSNHSGQRLGRGGAEDEDDSGDGGESSGLENLSLDSEDRIGTRRSRRQQQKMLRKKRKRRARQQSSSSGVRLRRSSRSRKPIESYDDAIGLEEDDSYFSLASSDSDDHHKRSARSARLATRRSRKKRDEQNHDFDEKDGLGEENETNGEESLDLDLSQSQYWDENTLIQNITDAGADFPPVKGSSSSGKGGRSTVAGKTRAQAQSKKKKRGGTGGNMKSHNPLEYLAETDRSWLQIDQQQENLYVPQMGDHVMYFPQGHREHLQLFTEDVSPPWNSFPQKWPVVECVVREIHYRFPQGQEYRGTTSVVAELTLAIIGTPSRTAITVSGQYIVQFVPPRQTRHSTGEQLIKVTLRNSHLPDFLVLYEIFMRSIKVAWHQGVFITVQYKEYNDMGEVVFVKYPGKVEALVNSDEEWPNSPWEALRVSWEDTNSSNSNNPGSSIDRISPWEAKAIHSAQVIFPRSAFDQAQTERITKKIEQLLIENDFEYEAFQFEVDSKVYPDYYSFVALPIYLELILRRLQNQYYRQLEALKADIDLLYENCRVYNSDLSAIVLTGSQLRDKLLKIVDPSLNNNQQEGVIVVENGEATRPKRSERREGTTMLRLRKTQREYNDSLVTTGVNESSSENPSLTISLKRKRVSQGENAKNNYNGRDEEEEEEEVSVGSSFSPRRKSSRLNHDQDDDGYFQQSPLLLTIKKRGSARPTVSQPTTQSTTRKRSTLAYHSEEDDKEEDNDEEEDEEENSSDPEDSKDESSYSRSDDVDNEEEEESESEEDGGSSDDSSPQRSSRRRRAPAKKKKQQNKPQRGKSSIAINGKKRQQAVLREEMRTTTTTTRSGRSTTATSQRTAATQSRYATRRSSIKSGRNQSDDSDVQSSSDEEEEEEEEEQVDSEDSSPIRGGRSRRSARTNSAKKRESSRITRSRLRASSLMDEEEDEGGYDDRRSSSRPRRSSRAKKEVKSYQEIDSNDDNDNSEEEGEARPAVRGRGKVAAAVAAAASAMAAQSSHSSRNPKRMDPEVKKTFQQIVSYAEQLDQEYNYFAEPVDPSEAIGYYDIIQHPMDLSTVRTKLLNREYADYQAMIDDILLIYENCTLYNQDDSVPCKEAKKQRKKFIAYLIKDLNIDLED